MRDIIIYVAPWWEKYLSKRSPLKHTCSWRAKLIVLWILNRQPKYSYVEKAKLEKLVKELYNHKKIGKSHIDLDNLLGEGDLPIQESIIIRKSAENFLLSTQILS